MFALYSGASPYPGMGGKEVMAQVRRGYRMDRPEHCSEEVYVAHFVINLP